MVSNRFAVVGVEGMLLTEDEDVVDIEGRGGKGTEAETKSAMVYLLLGEIDVVEKNQEVEVKKSWRENERLVLWFKYGSCCCTE